MKTLILAAFILLAGVAAAEAQSNAAQCLLLGYQTPGNSTVTLSCYGLDSNYEVKTVRVCPTFIGFYCSSLYTTAAFTKSGSNLTATFSDPVLPNGYAWQIAYCAAGQSGPNCSPASITGGGSAVGNCRQAQFATTTDEIGRVWSCIHN